MRLAMYHGFYCTILYVVSPCSLWKSRRFSKVRFPDLSPQVSTSLSISGFYWRSGWSMLPRNSDPGWEGTTGQKMKIWDTSICIYTVYTVYIYLFVCFFPSFFLYLFIILWLIKHGGPSKKHVFSVLIHGLKWSFSPDLLVTYAESQEIPSIPSPAAHLAGQPVT